MHGGVLDVYWTSKKKHEVVIDNGVGPLGFVVDYLKIPDLGRMARCCWTWNDFCGDRWLKDIYRRSVDQWAELTRILEAIQSSMTPSGGTDLSESDKIEKLFEAERSFAALVRYAVWDRESLVNSLGAFDLTIQNACVLFRDEETSDSLDSDEAHNVLLLEKECELLSLMDVGILRDCLRRIYDSAMWTVCLQRDFMLINYLFLLERLMRRLVYGEYSQARVDVYSDTSWLVRRILYDLEGVTQHSNCVQRLSVRLVRLIRIRQPRLALKMINYAFKYPHLSQGVREELFDIIEDIIAFADDLLAAKARVAKERYSSY